MVEPKQPSNARKLFERYEVLKDLKGSKIDDFKRGIGYKRAEQELERKRSLVSSYDKNLQADIDKAYGEFLAAMEGYESLDGINRIRKDPSKKNNWKIRKQLTQSALLQALPTDSTLQQAIKTKQEFNESAVKQMLADGTLKVRNGHVMDGNGQLLDEYITAELKPDEFKEIKSAK